ncbi:hypothetical protein MTO96_004192 [Rhipicephalus appendiculatus]
MSRGSPPPESWDVALQRYRKTVAVLHETWPRRREDEGKPLRAVAAYVTAKQRWFDGAQMLVAYLAPIYLAPLLLPGTMEGRCAYCMLIVFEYWVLNVIPAPMASSVPLVLLPLLGVMDPNLAAGHYMNVRR